MKFGSRCRKPPRIDGLPHGSRISHRESPPAHITLRLYGCIIRPYCTRRTPSAATDPSHAPTCTTEASTMRCHSTRSVAREIDGECGDEARSEVPTPRHTLRDVAVRVVRKGHSSARTGSADSAHHAPRRAHRRARGTERRRRSRRPMRASGSCSLHAAHVRCTGCSWSRCSSVASRAARSTSNACGHEPPPTGPTQRRTRSARTYAALWCLFAWRANANQ